ncbi:MAG TPA: Rrf2 family transcriptional regulator [bacterium]
MHVSKTLDYAVRSLIYLGLQKNNKVVYMKDISDNARIPKNYLAKVMAQLVKRGLVRSSVGPDGGYVLAKRTRDISLMDAYECVMGRLRIIDCLDSAFECGSSRNCRQIVVWGKLQEAVAHVLKKIKLNDIIRNGGKKKYA